jgi:hypothetical protein
MSAVVSALLIARRSRLLPAATVGGRMATARNPSASSRAAACQRVGLGADHGGHDLRRRIQRRDAEHRERVAQALRVGGHPRAFRLHSRYQVERGIDRAQHRRRQGRGENEAATAIHQPVDQRTRAGDIGAESAEGLAQRAHHHVHTLAGRGEAAPLRAEDAGGVGFVDIQQGAMAFGELHQRRQVGAVAVHAEHRFGDDQLAPGVSAQQLIEVVEVVVAKDMHGAARGARSMDDAGVVELVAEDGGTASARIGECGNHGGIGLEAAGEQQRCVAPLEGGELFLDRQRDVAGAGDQPRGRGAGAVACRPLGSACLQAWMLRKSKVVVGRHVDQGPPVGSVQPAIGHGQCTKSAAARAGVERGQFLAQQSVEGLVH